MHRGPQHWVKHESDLTPDIKRRLDLLHLAKIDMADEVLVLNVNDYVGASTRREVWYAQRKSKNIRMWEMPTKHTSEAIRGWFIGDGDWAAAAYEAAEVPIGSQR
jgi:hypothetical protein